MRFYTIGALLGVCTSTVISALNVTETHHWGLFQNFVHNVILFSERANLSVVLVCTLRSFSNYLSYDAREEEKEARGVRVLQL